MLNLAYLICSAASAIALELWVSSPWLWLQSSALYAFYLTIARGWLSALIFSFIAAALLQSHTGIIQLPSMLLMIFMAEWWRSMGDCSRSFKQLYPLIPSLMMCSLLSLLLNSSGSAVPLPMLLFSTLCLSSFCAPFLLIFWDFLADRCELPRYRVMDIYRGDEY